MGHERTDERMSTAFTRRFRVRHYECDAYGHLNNVNYVRYMQEVALDAAAAVGWDMAQHARHKRQWIIRETEIEYLTPLQYNQAVDVVTWIQDFRKVRSRRAYEFYRVDDGMLAAKALTDWVYVDTESGKPAPITQEVITAFTPQLQPDDNALGRFPIPPPQPDGTLHLQRRVTWGEVDSLGHVNNAAYLTYFEDAATEVGRSFGWPMQRQLDMGFAVIARRYRVLYQQPAQLDDELDIATWFSDSRRATVTRHYAITRERDGALLVRGRALWVCFDLNKMRPMRFPPELIADVAANEAK